MSDYDDDDSETLITPKPPTTTDTRSWWLQHPSRDGFTKRAEAEVPRMSASTEARLVNSLFIVGREG